VRKSLFESFVVFGVFSIIFLLATGVFIRYVKNDWGLSGEYAWYLSGGITFFLLFITAIIYAVRKNGSFNISKIAETLGLRKPFYNGSVKKGLAFDWCRYFFYGAFDLCHYAFRRAFYPVLFHKSAIYGAGHRIGCKSFPLVPDVLL
jgi:TRAP-type C4-dicarboxylate transport system permease small subunit